MSGKDTAEQHSAFWKYTLIPILRQFEQALESRFFMRLGLAERGVFDLWDIPELQESEDQQSRRDIAEINAGLKTINDVLKERGKEPKPWGGCLVSPPEYDSGTQLIITEAQGYGKRDIAGEQGGKAPSGL